MVHFAIAFLPLISLITKVRHCLCPGNNNYGITFSYYPRGKLTNQRVKLLSYRMHPFTIFTS